MNTADRGQDQNPVGATPDTIPFPDLRLQMNFYLTKNTSGVRWQLKKLWVNLKQVCMPLMTARIKSREFSAILPHPVLYSICLDSCGGEWEWCVVYLTSFFSSNLSMARDYTECTLGLRSILSCDSVLGLSTGSNSDPSRLSWK